MAAQIDLSVPQPTELGEYSVDRRKPNVSN
jgi:hypothetical protein